MAIKRTSGERVFDAINAIIMILLALICLYPLFHVLFSSFSDPAALMAHEGPILWPVGTPTLKGYEITLNNRSLGIGFRNTLVYMCVGTLMNVFLTSMAAYILTRSYFRIRKLMTKAMIFTMYFSGGIIPLFIIVTSIRIYDTPLAVILPTAISTYNVIITRTFFQNIPESMEESAIIDGAGDWTIYARIIMPLSKAVIAVITLYYAVGHWNSYFNAMIYLRDQSLAPLQIVLRNILIVEDMDSLEMMNNINNFLDKQYMKNLYQYSLIIVASAPVMMLYPFIQKYFVKGIMLGSLKG